MRAKHLYLALCVPGTILPWAAFTPFLQDHGADLRAFTAQLSPVVANLMVGVSLGLPLFLYLREVRREATP